MTDAEGIRRFIVAATQLEPALAAWLARAVWAGLSPSRRRRVRDDLFRGAAQLLPPMSTWAKAHLLASLARRPGRPGVSSAAALVSLALAVYRLERRDRELSAAQIFRALASRISPVEMQVAEVVDFSLLEALSLTGD